MKKRIVINADDFGQSSGISRGIIQAHTEGVVTSTSALVRWPGIVEAAELAREHPKLGIGLHIDFGEYFCRDGEWLPLYTVLPAKDRDREPAVRAEVERQLTLFHKHFHVSPTHFDSHQHVHRDEPLRSILVEMGTKLGIPVRHFTPGLQFAGDFYGQMHGHEPYPEGITAENLIRLIEQVGEFAEISCHPAAQCDHSSPYREERIVELSSLCDPRVRQFIERNDIELCKF